MSISPPIPPPVSSRRDPAPVQTGAGTHPSVVPAKIPPPCRRGRGPIPPLFPRRSRPRADGGGDPSLRCSREDPRPRADGGGDPSLRCSREEPAPVKTGAGTHLRPCYPTFPRRRGSQTALLSPNVITMKIARSPPTNPFPLDGVRLEPTLVRTGDGGKPPPYNILPCKGGSRTPLYPLQDPDPNRHSGKSRGIQPSSYIHFHRLMWPFLTIVLLSSTATKNLTRAIAHHLPAPPHQTAIRPLPKIPTPCYPLPMPSPSSLTSKSTTYRSDDTLYQSISTHIRKKEKTRNESKSANSTPAASQISRFSFS